ncbi:MAG: ATP-binding cassette domain-containing protein [Streptococcus sp.]|nr:ATP-binding cassette domain-containing protein [Streptococcus sp.]
METILEVKQISKKYGQHHALNKAHLSLKKGEIYGLIGKNGAGKSTLIKAITQLIHIDEGEITLFGSRDHAEWTHNLKRVGSVIETPVAYNHLTAYENLNYYCKVQHIANADTVIKEILKNIGLADTGKKKFRNFSFGMKQRLGLGIALISKPDLVILDEPINGLDPLGIKHFRQIVQQLQEEGTTFIISSHILSELYLIATKFGILEHGTIIKEITKAEFEQQSEDCIILKTNELDKASQLIHDRLGFPLKVINNEDEIHIFAHTNEINTIIKELVTVDIAIHAIYYAHKDLEQYFTDMITKED